MRIGYDIIHSFTRHQRHWDTSLAVEHCPGSAELFNELTFVSEIARIIRLALEGVYPSDVTHCRFHALYMELILQADGQAVKGTEWFSSFGIVIVEHTGSFERSVEEDFV